MATKVGRDELCAALQKLGLADRISIDCNEIRKASEGANMALRVVATQLLHEAQRARRDAVRMRKHVRRIKRRCKLLGIGAV
jgi:hypothetical protein